MTPLLALHRLPSHTGALSQSPPASNTGIDPALLFRPNPDFGYLRNSPRGDDEPTDRYFPQSRGTTQYWLDKTPVVSHDLHLPRQFFTIHQDAPMSPSPPSNSSVSSPEATDSISLSHSPGAKISGAPGFSGNDLLEGIETVRPHSGFGRNSRVLHYRDPQRHPSQTDNLVLPLPASHRESPIIQQRPLSDWSCAQATMFGVFCSLPSNSQNSQYTSVLESPGTASTRLMDTFDEAQFVAENLPQWRINQVKKGDAKKWQRMACLFCRARKIACARPAEHEPDQTCNQCARRRRGCVYPATSLRGQHRRNSHKSKE
ncbi:hypothetical protein C8R47DRAFT_1170325 [Mycena vitilis]|nr:hypothetical protein C8R47DRAFT_1170325 [Mycena vitilis]